MNDGWRDMLNDRRAQDLRAAHELVQLESSGAGKSATAGGFCQPPRLILHAKPQRLLQLLSGGMGGWCQHLKLHHCMLPTQTASELRSCLCRVAQSLLPWNRWTS